MKRIYPLRPEKSLGYCHPLCGSESVEEGRKGERERERESEENIREKTEEIEEKCVRGVSIK